jgi:hypothetical protein
MNSPTGLQFEYVSGCLTVRATGRGMIEHKELSIQAIAEAIAAQPVNAALVDMRELAPPYTFMDRYQIGELTGRYLNKIPIAALARHEQVDRQRIGQVVAVNRGAKLEIFTDPAAADTWLKHYATPST